MFAEGNNYITLLKFWKLRRTSHSISESGTQRQSYVKEMPVSKAITVPQSTFNTTPSRKPDGFCTWEAPQIEPGDGLPNQAWWGLRNGQNVTSLSGKLVNLPLQDLFKMPTQSTNINTVFAWIKVMTHRHWRYDKTRSQLVKPCQEMESQRCA